MALLISCIFNVVAAYVFAVGFDIKFLSSGYEYMIVIMILCNLSGMIYEKYCSK